MYKAIFLLFLTTLASAQPRHHYRKHADTRLFPPSAQSQLAQNAWVDQYGLQRYQNDRDLQGAIERGDLVEVTATSALSINARLPLGRRYVRPWVIPFLTALSTRYYERFHQPLILTSAVRTVKVQRSLRHWNHNAAPAHGDVASSHLAGSTIDLSRRMTKEQNQWMEETLMNDYAVMGKVIVMEETGQWCWHIMVKPEVQWHNQM